MSRSSLCVVCHVVCIVCRVCVICLICGVVWCCVMLLVTTYISRSNERRIVVHRNLDTHKNYSFVEFICFRLFLVCSLFVLVVWGWMLVCASRCSCLTLSFEAVRVSCLACLGSVCQSFFSASFFLSRHFSTHQIGGNRLKIITAMIVSLSVTVSHCQAGHGAPTCGS